MEPAKRIQAAEARRRSKALQEAQIAERLRHIRSKILVMSGKGGVGKSSVAAYLSGALAKTGHSGGLMDVDLHGPSIPRLLGIKEGIRSADRQGKMLPFRYLPRLKVMSIEVLSGDTDAATIWRGPLKGSAIRQFIADIEWMDLDYLIIDSPPGTGDEPLTVAQTIRDARALIVTTPQEISLADVRKSIDFCRRVGLTILGIVENMSGLQCPHCGRMIPVFSRMGGEITARKENLPLLASLPFELEVVRRGDAGDVSLLDNDQLPITRAFKRMVAEIEELTRQGTH